MSDDDNWFVSAAKSPYLPIAAGLARGIVGIASSFGFTWALTVSGDQITMAATAAVALAMLGWSVWQKISDVRASRRAEVAAAVASAKVGVPVTVIETAAGHENIAARIAPAEIVAAPIVQANAPLMPVAQP